MSLVLRRTMCRKWPRPIDAVSPSPETPTLTSWRLAALTPTAIAAMRPWTALKPCDWPRKYAVVFDEQPMPLSFARLYGEIPYSNIALISELVIASCPQPEHSVDSEPL